MQYAPILTLTLEHGFYGAADIPLQLRPTDAYGFNRMGCMLRTTGNQTVIVANLNDQVPERVTLDVCAQTPEIFSVTKGSDWRNVPHFIIGSDVAEVLFDPDGTADVHPQRRSDRLARLTLEITGAPDRAVTMKMKAVEALWAYFLCGSGVTDDLEVIDATGNISFTEQDPHFLPDGSKAQVWLSDRALPARARPDQKFALQRTSPFGPEPVIPVLPAAGITFKSLTQEAGGAARLQSDIYVSLW